MGALDSKIMLKEGLIMSSVYRARSAGMWRALAFIVLLGAAPTIVAAQGITPEQVVAIERVTSVAMSPDGSRIAYTLSKPRPLDDEDFGRARSELWLIPAAGGEATAIVRAPGSGRSPQWSPNGQMLAFTAKFAELDPNTQVYGVTIAGGDPKPLTHSPIDVLGFAWSPDGKAIAYTAREAEDPKLIARRERGDDVQVAGAGERFIRLWVQRLDSGERMVLTPENRHVWSFAWAPHAGELAVQMSDGTTADDGLMFRRLYTVSATGGSYSLLTETEGKLGSMAYSPDGSKLAFAGATSLNDPIAQSVFVIPADGGQAANRTEGYGGSVTGVGWLDDKTLYFRANQGTRTVVNRLKVEGGEVERFAGGGAEIITTLSFDRGRRNFAAAAHTAQHPRELFVGTTRRGELKRLTHHNGWLSEVDLAEQETIEWTAPDGWRIEGVLVHPLNERPGTRYPLTILPHGGPEGVSLDGWTTRSLYPAQLLAAQGYAVLMPNYRGSGGRGVEFSKADHRDLGGKEFEDVIAGIDHLAEQGLIDPERVGSSGTSYGGYFSAWAATRHSDRFKAAITFAGLSNWASFTGTTDIPYEMSIVHWDLWWFDNPLLNWERSPVAHVSESSAPTLVGHGLADERVHPEQSLEIYTALRIKGVPTGLLLYPREPHGLLEPAHQLDFMRRMLEWFGRYLQGGPPATS